MTDIKIDSKILADVAAALTPHANQMFSQRNGHWVAVVELAHSERTEPGPEEDKDRSVKIRITQIEVAADEFTDERLRQAMQDMYRRRTSSGTLDSLMPGATRANSLLGDAA